MGYARYTVTDNRTGEIVCEEAEARVAMKAMGLKTVVSFYSAASRAKSGENRRWTIKATDGKTYTIYDNKADFPVCIDATAHEAMVAMGLTSMNGFYSTVSRARRGRAKRWSVVEESEDIAEMDG